MNRIMDAHSIELARDIAERDIILSKRRSGDWSDIAAGRLLTLNSRIATRQAAGIIPAFTNTVTNDSGSLR